MWQELRFLWESRVNIKKQPERNLCPRPRTQPSAVEEVALERMPCNLGLWNRTKFRPQPSCRRRDGLDKPLELESETNPCWTYRADCARPSIRALTSSHSHTNAALFLPDTVAASISVPSNMTVARSALHGRQNLPILPGRSKSSVTRPHTLQS